MQLRFIGAAHEVTGSCHFVSACGRNFLLDCGLEQGADIYENAELPVSPADIDYVFLSHAHIDHSGMIPYLYAHGFRGSVYATEATTDLCNIMLRDSAHIQMFEAEWRNRKAKRAGKEEYVPLYELKDAVGVMELFIPCPYGKIIDVCEGIRIRFVDVGHLLGSASVEVWLEEGDLKRKIAFSGDVGNYDQPIIKDPEYLSDADYVIMESTYGDRLHDRNPDNVAVLAKIIQETFERGGNVVIPSFAVGRTQEMLYFIRQIKQEGLVKGFDGFEVYIDSPLAVEATGIFHENVDECFDEEALSLVRQGINPIRFPGLKVAVSADESKAINFDPKPKVIISASGMCEAGRIKHHLKHNLWRPESTVLFVGYQANGTLGRAIYEGAREVKLFGETIEVRARIEKFIGISGHADRDGLLHWVQAFSKKPQKVFVVHGEDAVTESFAALLRNELCMNAVAPFTGALYDLKDGSLLEEGCMTRLERAAGRQTPGGVFARLLAAGQRLLTVIRHNEHGANKDMAKFADQINALCDKWDR